MKKFIASQKWYFYIALCVWIYVVISQAYAIFIVQKPFWLDEWFVISSLKFRSYESLFFKVLDYGIEFPRVYFSFLKLCATTFNFSEISLRLIPYIIGIAAITFSYYLAKTAIYKDNIRYAVLFFLLILCNSVTNYYLIQVKQYTMDFLCALLAIWQYSYYCEEVFYGETKKIQRYLSLGLFFIAPFFSYTYPIAVAPVISLLGLTWLASPHERLQKFLRFAAPAGCFLLGIAIAYMVDIRVVLADPQMKIYWHDYFVDYSSAKHFFSHFLNSLHYFLGDIIFTPTSSRGNTHATQMIAFFIPWIMTFFALFGIISTIKMISREGKNRFFHFDQPNKFNHYFVWLLTITLGLYFLKMLPLEGGRLNYFASPMRIFFVLVTVQAMDSWINRTIGSRIISTLALGVSLLFILYSYSDGFLPSSKWYDAKAYKNYGAAIHQAQKLNVPIVVLQSAAPYQWRLIVQTHPAYNVQTMLPVITGVEGQFCSSKSLLQYSQFVVIDKYNYQWVHCHKDSARKVVKKSICNEIKSKKLFSGGFWIRKDASCIA